MNYLKLILLLSLTFFIHSALKVGETTNFKQDTTKTKWIAPTSADELTNPIASNEETLAEGILIYKKNCRSCHGRNGDGQGVGAEDCKVAVTDFTKPEFAKQSDGALFWKIQEGRNDMASYKDELDEEEIWKVINFICTFSQTAEE